VKKPNIKEKDISFDDF